MGKLATTKMSSKCQVVIPEDFRKEMGLRTGTNSWSWEAATWLFSRRSHHRREQTSMTHRRGAPAGWVWPNDRRSQPERSIPQLAAGAEHVLEHLVVVGLLLQTGIGAREQDQGDVGGVG